MFGIASTLRQRGRPKRKIVRFPLYFCVRRDDLHRFKLLNLCEPITEVMVDSRSFVAVGSRRAKRTCPGSPSSKPCARELQSRLISLFVGARFKFTPHAFIVDGPVRPDA